MNIISRVRHTNEPNETSGNEICNIWNEKSTEMKYNRVGTAKKIRWTWRCSSRHNLHWIKRNFKKQKKNEQSFGDMWLLTLWDNMWYTIGISGAPADRSKDRENICWNNDWKIYMLLKGINSQVQKAQQIPSIQEKGHVHRGIKIRMTVDLVTPGQTGDNGIAFLMCWTQKLHCYGVNVCVSLQVHMLKP